jgi:hypothetical protein
MPQPLDEKNEPNKQSDEGGSMVADETGADQGHNAASVAVRRVRAPEDQPGDADPDLPEGIVINPS